MTDFGSMKKDEVVVLAKELEAKVAELAAAPADPVQAGMIQILSLWGTDPQGNPYKDKNDESFYVGQMNARFYLSKNKFKTVGSRQPDVRGSVMPFRAQDNDEAGDLFDGLDKAPVEDAEPPPF